MPFGLHILNIPWSGPNGLNMLNSGTRSEIKITTSNQEDFFAHNIGKTKENKYVNTFSRKIQSLKNLKDSKKLTSHKVDTTYKTKFTFCSKSIKTIIYTIKRKEIL